MGNCWNCGKQITLKDEEVKCDECGTVVNYQCHECHTWFSVYDEKTEEKIKECGICGFFVCPNCGTCGSDCEKNLWQTKIKKILAPEIRYDNIPTLQEKINRLVQYIEDIKIGHEQKTCPDRKVSITYAKGRIKSCIVRTEGYKCKNLLDIQKFQERIEKIGDVDLGTQLTINQAREEGTYGQEYRDVFNTLVCYGQLEKELVTRIIDGEQITMEVWRRIEKGKCPNLDLTNLIVKFCPKCKTNYLPNQDYCPKEECIILKGKDKGKFRKLNLKISNKDICQLNRGLFKEVENGRTKI